MQRTAALVLALGMLHPEAAWGHAADRGLILLLPTGYYLWGGAAAVAITFALLAAGSGLRSTGLRWTARRRSGVGSWIGFGVFWALIATGIWGVRDPLANPLTLVVWTLWWIGFPVAVALFGDLWSGANPWSGPVRLVRRLSGPAPLRLPRGWGRVPAILGFGAFVWFESVSLAPNDPARLARAAALFWAVQFAAMVAVGEARWRLCGEPFSVLFRLLGRMAPIWRGGAALPGARLARGAGLSVSGWLFVIAAIAGVTFDGLSGTFWWLGLIGVNPLEFPGRSAVVAQNTAGLIAVWLAMAAAFWLAVRGGAWLAGVPAGRGAVGRLALSLLPIALAYHAAHYLVAFLVNAQYALVALSDPLGTGGDWLGLSTRPVRLGFLSDLSVVERIWQTQAVLIVGGHLMAVAIADAVARRIWPGPRAGWAQLPLAALMVGYTVLGLWLLSAPAGA